MKTMKIKWSTRVALAAVAMVSVVAFSSSSLYAAPALGPDGSSVVTAPKPENPGNGGANGNSGSSNSGQRRSGQ
jgi:hypothetical protein